jgi:phage gp29-like protein
MPRYSRVLGPDGERIDLDALFGEPQAAPQLYGYRQATSVQHVDGLTPWKLAAVHRAAANGEPQAWLELAEDIEERDPHYLSVLGTRKRQVCQLPATVEAASDDAEHVKHADLVRDWLKEGVLDDALFDMLDALGKGFSVLEIDWDASPKRIVPAALSYRPQRWFIPDRTDGETILLREGVAGQPLAEHKFVVHRHKAKSGLTIRSGLARIASWSWMFKAFTTKDWQVFIQNYAAPIRVGKYEPTASDVDKGVLAQAVFNIAGDAAAIIPKGMEIEFVGLKDTTKSAEAYEKRCDWLDRQISKLVLGQTTTTDAVSGGHAVSQEHRLVQEDIERADARAASTTIKRQLIRQIVAFTFGPQEFYPDFRIGRPDELPLEQVVNALDKLVPLGLKVEASQVRDRIGFTEPAEGAEILAARTPAPPGSLPPPGREAAELDQLRHLVSRHASAPEPEFVDRLTERAAEDAAGALAGLTGAVKEAFDAASDLPDLADRLGRLELDPGALADAMGRVIALSHLTGRAALLDEISGERDDRRG